MIKIRNLSFQYSSGESVLENINLDIAEGEIFCIIGKNGAGKSSLARLIAGITKPSNGKIWIDEIDRYNEKMRIEIRKKVGIVFQNPETQILFPKVYNDLEFALKNLNLLEQESRIQNALKKVQMEDYITKDIDELSLGQKQRINLASALSITPKYFILDEPTTMIDSQGKDKIYEVIRQLKKEGCTVIFVTNQMDEIFLSDRILVLENKKIKNIFRREDIFENRSVFEESQIKIPELLQIIFALKEKNMDVSLQEWTIEEMKQAILRLCEK